MYCRATVEQQGKRKVMRQLQTRQRFLPHPAPALLFYSWQNLKQQDGDSQGEAHIAHDCSLPHATALSPHLAVTIALAVSVVLLIFCYLTITYHARISYVYVLFTKTCACVSVVFPVLRSYFFHQVNVMKMSLWKDVVTHNFVT